MKKLINEVDDVVTEQLEGMAAAHPDLLKVNYDPNYVYRADAPVAGKVAIVSGGGSGHEPMHGGFVGMGMLDGACPGEVFTSPTPDQMYECAAKVDSGAGVLFIVNIQVAYLTPPFGFVLFWIKSVMPPDVTMGDIYRSVGPFILLQLLGLALIFMFPQIGTWLPSLMN